MKITYDRTLKLAGVGLVPWPRLGPEKYFTNYIIASLYSWDIKGFPGVPENISLETQSNAPTSLARLNTYSLLRDPTFQGILNNQLRGYSLLTYKSVDIPAELEHRKFLMTDKRFAIEFENKVNFRNLLKDKIRFPEYKIVHLGNLDLTEASYYELTSGAKKIFQDEQLSGGKGSFIVDNFKDYCSTISNLRRQSQDGRIIISDFIEDANERSIQVCISSNGIFIGPLQRQIVSHSLLANLETPESDKFCGVQILDVDQGSRIHLEAEKITQIIAEILADQGYKGIFGVDFLVRRGELYVLEANTRITGVTPLLTALYNDEKSTPFYLLHILELGDYPYQIIDTNSVFDRTGALLLIHSLENYTTQIVDIPLSGTYRLQEGKLQLFNRSTDMTKLKPREFVIQTYRTAGGIVRAGGLLLNMQFYEQILDETSDELYNSTVEIISAIRNQIVLKPQS